MKNKMKYFYRKTKNLALLLTVLSVLCIIIKTNLISSRHHLCILESLPIAVRQTGRLIFIIFITIEMLFFMEL